MTNHSLELDRLHQMAKGTGGQTMVIEGQASDARYIIGLKHKPETSCLTACLKSLQHYYDDILIISGFNSLLPHIALSPKANLGQAITCWQYKSSRTSDDGNEDRSTDALTQQLFNRFGHGQSNALIWSLQQPTWVKQITDSLDEVSKRISNDRRTLIILCKSIFELSPIQHQNLLTDKSNISDYNYQHFAHQFAHMPESVSGTTSDLIFLTHHPTSTLLQNGRLTKEYICQMNGPAHLKDLIEEQLPFFRWEEETFQYLVFPNVEDAPFGKYLPSSESLLYRALRKTSPVIVDSIMDELDALIGMDAAKLKVRELIELLKLELTRKQMGITVKPHILHTSITGNAGVGKTILARILSKTFYQMGLIKTKAFTSCTPADLIGQYVGETSQKTKDVIQRAKGGTLFIDEAYGLTPTNGNPYGEDAIRELLAPMLEHPEDLVVIIAGYADRIAELIRTNQGFGRRFKNHIHISDYTNDQLVDIAHYLAAQSDFTISPDSHTIIKAKLQHHRELMQQVNQAFGNGGEVEKLISSAKIAQAFRLSNVQHKDIQTLQTLLPEDFLNATLDIPGGTHEP